MSSLISVKPSCTFIHRTLVSWVKGGFCSIVRLWSKLSNNALAGFWWAGKGYCLWVLGKAALLPSFGEYVGVVLLLGFGEQARVDACKC